MTLYTQTSPVECPGKTESHIGNVKLSNAMKHFTSLSITGAGVADAVHQRFLHDLQAAECVGLCTRQRPPTTISCRAASMVGVIATLQLVHSALMSIKNEFHACNSRRCCIMQRPYRPIRLCAMTLACCPAVRLGLAFGWLWRCSPQQLVGSPMAGPRALAKAREFPFNSAAWMMLRASASRLSTPLQGARNVGCVRRTVLTRTMASLQKTSYGQDERIPAWIGGPAERPAVIVLQVQRIPQPLVGQQVPCLSAHCITLEKRCPIACWWPK